MQRLCDSLAGVSRSATLAAAYIMSIAEVNCREALRIVQVGRDVANPNVGFQRQLRDFEGRKLTEVDTSQFAKAGVVALSLTRVR
ncbi:DUSP22 [Cordylochernes scorpioides]|uniref:DUSP22 n=1 Tax=Cordylochernes scorpioides TaxID=51811 RepID=A0ABY6LJ38_9ARAC|nr:DUSP22 [Cordylochernes scorpioides]